jgi:antitoxin component YwqK of YwqJK toxin-antitoxin module
LDDPETRKQIIAEAIDLEKLQKRGQKGEELFYASNEQTPYTGWTKYWRHGYVGTERLSQFKDGKREGLWTFMHNNGRKRSEGIYKDGKKDGLWTSWHVNGPKQSEGIYKDGKKDGLWTSWQSDGLRTPSTRYENGQKMMESTWKDAEPKTPFYFHPVFWVLIATLLLVGAVYLILRVKKLIQKELTPEEAESRVLEDEESAAFSETRDQIKRNALETAIRKTLYQPHRNNAAKDVTSLEVLSAGGQGISDLSGLRDARNLTYLDLSGNRITDITVLSGLTELTELNLRTNQITDITPLANLINLEELWLYENKITDLTPLAKLKNLSKLYLGLNDFTDEQKTMLKKTLPNCDITF